MIISGMHAWVIHKYWSGDTSARVVFFTQEHGLLHCLCKGGRTPQKQALLQAFTPLWLAADMRGNACFARQYEIAAAPMQFDGHNLFAGLYINELLYHALKPQDPHVTLYTAYTQALRALSMAVGRFAIEAILRRFEWVLLTACGYSMSLTNEAHSANPIVSHNHYRFIPGEGFILAKEGIRGEYIIALSQDKLEEPAVLNAAKQIMRKAIDYVIDGKEIKARKLYTIS